MKISSLSIDVSPQIVIYEDSKDAKFIRAEGTKYVKGTTTTYKPPSSNIDDDGSMFDGDDSDDSIHNDTIPSLSDIALVTTTTYIDDKGQTRAKLVFRVRNSSEEDLAGVDARISIPTTGGGR